MAERAKQAQSGNLRSSSTQVLDLQLRYMYIMSLRESQELVALRLALPMQFLGFTTPPCV